MGERWAGRVGSAAWQVMRDAAGALLAMAAPDDCRVCHLPRQDPSRNPVCATCLESFWRIRDPMCAICGRQLPAGALPISGRMQCALCRREIYGFDAARSFAAYDRSMMRAITLLKHQPIRPLAVWFGARLAEVARDALPDFQADLVVPVPLHPERLRERGFNQAELIAGAVARRLLLPLQSDAIERQRPRPPKLRLSRHERWEVARGAYAPRPGGRIDNRRVLLVDDVFTTGATLDACARALRLAGAAQVAALSVARVTEAWAGAVP